ncbi:Hypothetical predicted protein, partial [Pelobates cultripes]
MNQADWTRQHLNQAAFRHSYAPGRRFSSSLRSHSTAGARAITSSLPSNQSQRNEVITNITENANAREQRELQLKLAENQRTAAISSNG